MNNIEIGNIIKRIRKDNKFTQAELAEQLGVTYQAVSKWETGKNIPDIAIIKKISKDYNINIDLMLEDTFEKKSRKNKKKISIIIFIMISLLIIIFVFFNNENLNLKKITTNSTDFNVEGCVVFNNNISSIYISSIDYDGKYNEDIFSDIKFTLYEENNDKLIEIDQISINNDKNKTFENIINEISFTVTNYEASCKTYESNNLYIKAITTDKNGKTINLEIPFLFDESCNCQ